MDIRTEYKVNPESNCWEFTRAIGNQGYGMLWDAATGRVVTAHRMAYRTFIGPIPDGSWVLHKCDNRKCINPAHLFLGDVKINAADCASKGRFNSLRPSLCKLNATQVNEIRSSDLGQRALGRKYHVDHMVISRIQEGIGYKHIQTETHEQ